MEQEPVVGAAVAGEEQDRVGGAGQAERAGHGLDEVGAAHLAVVVQGEQADVALGRPSLEGAGELVVLLVGVALPRGWADLREGVDDDEARVGVTLEVVVECFQGPGGALGDEVESLGPGLVAVQGLHPVLKVHVGPSSRASMTTPACSVGMTPSAIPPDATARDRSRAIQLLPTLGDPASSVSPSATRPSTAHRSGGKVRCCTADALTVRSSGGGS